MAKSANVKIAIFAAVVASASFAQARPDTRRMTCDQARALVKSEKEIVMTTGANTYDKFVEGVYYCEDNEQANPVWAPTRDSSKFMVGLV